MKTFIKLLAVFFILLNYEKYSIIYLIISSSLFYFINPYYILVLFPIIFFYDKSFVIPYAIYTLIMLIFRFKNKIIKNIFPLSCGLFLILVYSILNLNFTDSILFISILFIYYLFMTPFIFNDGIKDERTFNLYFFIPSLIYLYLYKNEINFLLLSSLITYKREVFVYISSSILGYKYDMNFHLINFILLSMSFIKQKRMKIILYACATFILYLDNIYNLIPLITSFINFILSKDNIYILTKDNDKYLSYIRKLKHQTKSLDMYQNIEANVIKLIKNYCICCPNKNTCTKMGKLNLYQYLMYQSLNNVKNNPNIKYFINNCIYKDMMDKHEKKDFNPYLDVLSMDNLLSYNIYQNEDLQKINHMLNKYNYYVKKIEDNSINTLDIKVELGGFYSYSILKKRLKKLLKKDLSFEISNNTISVYEKPKFKIVSDSLVLAKGNIYISGDNVLFNQSKSDFYFALSDGMGSGLRAYEASKDMLMRLDSLINLKINDDLILDNLKHMYNYSAIYDSYGTLDLLHINKSNQKCSLYKVASSITLLIRNEEIYEYKTDTLPLGSGDIITKYDIDLECYDLILLLSDGVTDHVDKTSLYEYIKSICREKTEKISSLLSNYVYQRCGGKLLDDLSVITIKILPLLN